MRTHWHAKSHHLVATRGPVSVSVEVEWDHFYTDVRLWWKYFEAKVGRCKEMLDDAGKCSGSGLEDLQG